MGLQLIGIPVLCLICFFQQSRPIGIEIISNSSNSFEADFDDATAVETIGEASDFDASEGKKLFLNGKLVISKGGKFFNLAGQEL